MRTIALLPAGSVSDEAAKHFFAGEEVRWKHHRLIADVFQSTVNGVSDYSVIPIENTIEGSVSLHMDWLVHEVDLPIRAEWVFPAVQNLVGRLHEFKGGEGGGWNPASIQKVFSHPVAMAQCYDFLRSRLPHAELETLSSTAEAMPDCPSAAASSNRSSSESATSRTGPPDSVNDAVGAVRSSLTVTV